jgi:hypothetical protein
MISNSLPKLGSNATAAYARRVGSVGTIEYHRGSSPGPGEQFCALNIFVVWSGTTLEFEFPSNNSTQGSPPALPPG